MPAPIKLRRIHNEILKWKMRELEMDVKRRTPEIQTSEMIKKFLSSVNTFTFRERLKIAYRILFRKL